ncbi:hypothetical protein V500_03861 [Pseudogymnoascus sp. VKM F-4518 (FW-2643)]|nr:hypothetical protein V500_03861 [Pseudogymnoascus sp. VKM F-4518 (FW-2643)]
MAEPFGISAGAIGIAAAFSACIECFAYIQFGRHFGRDFQTDQLTLSCARLRLARWGESVDIYNDSKLGKVDATVTQIQVAKDTLFQILVLFAETESISKNYKSAAKTGEDLSPFSTDDMDRTIVALDNKMERLAVKRQKGSRLRKLTSWALYHRTELKELLKDIVSLIDSIENLFPAPEAQMTLVRQEAAALGDKESLELIKNKAKGIDGLLQTAIQELLTGHQYLNVVEVGQGGKALIGNKYGGNGNSKQVNNFSGTISISGGKTIYGNTFRADGGTINL